MFNVGAIYVPLEFALNSEVAQGVQLIPHHRFFYE
jgi:hypothetical protein